jgi:hypothetical protein
VGAALTAAVAVAVGAAVAAAVAERKSTLLELEYQIFRLRASCVLPALLFSTLGAPAELRAPARRS